MPSQALTSGELDAFRGAGHASDVWLSVVPAATVGTAHINQATFTNPVTQLTVDNTSVGWTTYVRRGMTVWIGTTAGARDIGVYRVRSNPTSTILYIAEMSSGDPGMLALSILRPLADNAYITVIRDWNLWSIFPVIENGEFLKDVDTPYTDQNELSGEIPGYINVGVHPVGHMDGSTIDFTFTADVQWFETIGSASIDWTFANGTPGTATGAGPHTVSFPAGTHEVSVAAVSDNGGEAFAVRQVFAHDFAVNPPYSVKILGDRATKQGRRVSAEIIGTGLDDTPLQTGAMVVLWEELYFENGDTLDSACTQLTGWIESISGGDDGGVPTYRVEIIQALHRLEQIRGFSQVLTATANPSNWQEVSPALCHFNFYVFYLLYWHTTLLSLFDYDAQDFVEVVMNTWANDPGDWYSTINRLGSFVSAELGQASDGTLYLRRKPSLMNNTDRNLLVERVTLTLNETTCDLAIIPDMERRQFPEVGQTQGFAFQYNYITGQKTGLKSYAPGEVPGQGGRTEQMPDQWVAHPSHLDLLVSNYHAMVNNPYPRVTVQLTRSNTVNALLTAPAEMYWIELEVDADHWPEGVAFSSRCVVEDVSITWNDDGTKDATLNLVPETNGNYAPAQQMPVTIDDQTDPTTVQFPSIDPIDGTLLIPYDNLLGLPPASTPVVSEDEQVSGVLFAWSENAVGIAYNPATPAFLIFWSPPTSETLQSLVFDRRSPRFTTDRLKGALRLWAATDTNFYYCANALASNPAMLQRVALDTNRLVRGVNGVVGGVVVYGSGEFPAIETLFDSLFIDSTLNMIWSTPGTVLGQTYRIVLSGTYQVNTFDHPGAYDDAWYTQYPTPGGPWSGPYQHIVMDDDYTVTPAPAYESSHIYEFERTGTGGEFTATIADTPRDDNDGGILMEVYTTADSQCTGTAYSDDNGETWSYTQFGAGVLDGPGGMDCDDYNLGVVVGVGVTGSGTSLYCTQAYTDAVADLISGIPTTTGSTQYNLVRIPHRRLNSTQLNNDETALHIIWGSDHLISGEALWWGVLNVTTATMSSITPITPDISAVLYVPVGPEALETYAGDSRITLLLARPSTGGNIVRLRSIDAGATWALAGTVSDFSFVRWTGKNRAWFGGEDGIGFTSDRGVGLDDRDGDYELVIEAFPLIGVEAV